MKIVYLNPVAILGGAERSLLDLMVSVRRADASVNLHLIVGTEGPLVDEVERIGGEVTVLPMPTEMLAIGDSAWKRQNPLKTGLMLAQQGPAVGKATWKYVCQLRNALRAIQPDLIHSNGLKFHLLCHWTGLRSVPVVWHIRDFLSLRPAMARMLRWTSAGVRGGIAISQAVAADARTVLPRVPIELVYNAIDTELFSPGRGDGPALDVMAGLEAAAADTLRVGLVATFARWKGQELFLYAASQFLGRFRNAKVRFYIIGGPVYQTRGSQYSEEELRATAIALNVSDRVGMIGFQQNPVKIFRALDIVVHASTQPEPFGRTIVEAMACGKPVIVSRAGGAAELFTHGHDAVGFPPGDVDALTHTLANLVHAPDSRRQLATNARQTILQRFQRGRFGPQILAAYRRFLQRGEQLRRHVAH